MSGVTDLSDRLRQLRLSKGWSQQRLAAETGLAHRTISRLETPGGPTPNRSTLRLVAQALGVEPEELINGCAA